MWTSGQVVRAASAWDFTPAKVAFSDPRHPERAAEQREPATPGAGKGLGAKKTPRAGGTGGFFGAGDWLAAAFTPRGPLAPDPPARCVYVGGMRMHACVCGPARVFCTKTSTIYVETCDSKKRKKFCRL